MSTLLINNGQGFKIANDFWQLTWVSLGSWRSKVEFSDICTRFQMSADVSKSACYKEKTATVPGSKFESNAGTGAEHSLLHASLVPVCDHIMFFPHVFLHFPIFLWHSLSPVPRKFFMCHLEELSADWPCWYWLKMSHFSKLVFSSSPVSLTFPHFFAPPAHTPESCKYLLRHYDKLHFDKLYPDWLHI